MDNPMCYHAIAPVHLQCNLMHKLLFNLMHNYSTINPMGFNKSYFRDCIPIHTYLELSPTELNPHFWHSLGWPVKDHCTDGPPVPLDLLSQTCPDPFAVPSKKKVPALALRPGKAPSSSHWWEVALGSSATFQDGEAFQGILGLSIN